MTSGLTDEAVRQCQQGPFSSPLFSLPSSFWPLSSDQLPHVPRLQSQCHKTLQCIPFFPVPHFKNEETFPKSPHQISLHISLVITVSHVHAWTNHQQGANMIDYSPQCLSLELWAELLFPESHGKAGNSGRNMGQQLKMEWVSTKMSATLPMRAKLWKQVKCPSIGDEFIYWKKKKKNYW